MLSRAQGSGSRRRGIAIGVPNVELSVVVVNWNGGATVLQCIRALLDQEDPDFEIVLVDNASTDGSPGRVRELCSRVRLISLERNHGFAEGCNRGIEAARGAWILTLNNDAFASRNWIGEIRKAILAAAPDVGMLQSHLVFADRPHLTNSTGVHLSSVATFFDRDYELPDRNQRTLEEVFCPTAGAAAYRRSMLLETRLPSGYFDSTFFMYYEDADLGWRCRLAGWRALYVPGAVVQHQYQGSSHRHGSMFVPAHCIRNRVRTALKNASLPMLLRGGGLSVRDALWLLRKQGVRGAAAYAHAVFDGLRQRPSVNRVRRERRIDVEKRWIQCSPDGSPRPARRVRDGDPR